MPVAGYFAVEKAIKDAILSDSDLSEVKVFIEQDIVHAAESAPCVLIFANSREAPAGEQRLAAGRRTDWIVSISIICYGWALETEPAAEIRDSLMERVELALMRDRTLGGTCEALWLDGGSFDSGPGNQGFLCAGEIALKVKVFGTV